MAIFVNTPKDESIVQNWAKEFSHNGQRLTLISPFQRNKQDPRQSKGGKPIWTLVTVNLPPCMASLPAPRIFKELYTRNNLCGAINGEPCIKTSSVRKNGKDTTASTLLFEADGSLRESIFNHITNNMVTDGSSRQERFCFRAFMTRLRCHYRGLSPIPESRSRPNTSARPTTNPHPPPASSATETDEDDTVILNATEDDYQLAHEESIQLEADEAMEEDPVPRTSGGNDTDDTF